MISRLTIISCLCLIFCEWLSFRKKENTLPNMRELEMDAISY